MRVTDILGEVKGDR